MDQPELFIRDYRGEHNEEHYSSHCIWEIEHDTYDERGRAFKLNVAEANDFRDNNANKISMTFRLRHFSSGKLLISSKSGQSHDHNKIYENIYLSPISSNLEENEDYCKFKVEPILKNFDYIEEKKTYYLNSDGHYMKSSVEELQRSMIQERYMEQLQNNAEGLPGTDLFTPLEDKDFNEDRFDVCMSKDISSEDAFIFEKVGSEEIYDLLYVRSALPALKLFNSIMKNQNQDKLTSE